MSAARHCVSLSAPFVTDTSFTLTHTWSTQSHTGRAHSHRQRIPRPYRPTQTLRHTTSSQPIRPTSHRRTGKTTHRRRSRTTRCQSAATDQGEAAPDSKEAALRELNPAPSRSHTEHCITEHLPTCLLPTSARRRSTATAVSCPASGRSVSPLAGPGIGFYHGERIRYHHSPLAGIGFFLRLGIPSTD